MDPFILGAAAIEGARLQALEFERETRPDLLQSRLRPSFVLWKHVPAPNKLPSHTSPQHLQPHDSTANVLRSCAKAGGVLMQRIQAELGRS